MKSSFVITSPVAAALVLLLLLSWPSEGAERLSCSSVNEYMRPCLPYLKAGSGRPAPPCCAGARALKAAAATRGERRLACMCIKTKAETLKPNPDAIRTLPDKCGITLPFAMPDAVCTNLD